MKRKEKTEDTAKPFVIDKRWVWEAYKAVKRNKGCAGVDTIDFKQFDKRMQDNLYKLWNRMSSGCYMPEPVLQVEIPKSNGGKRPLGIPTILDRIAQMTVVMQITPRLETIFHQDSYGYRPNKSAHDAIGKARERCFKYEWVLDMDISKFFDTIDHDLGAARTRALDAPIHRTMAESTLSDEGRTANRADDGSTAGFSDRAGAGQPVPALCV